MGWPEDCKHHTTELRLWAVGGNSRQAKHQCLDCGTRLGLAEKINGRDIPPADMSMYESREELIAEHWQRKAGSLLRPEAVPEDRKAEYHEYLQTDRWRVHRQRVIERDGGVCQSCLKTPATDVHHLTYNYGFHAPAFALVAVCRRCHEWLHALTEDPPDTT
jgi:5-methylcytosine-specific restriction endonuclease McrA